MKIIDYTGKLNNHEDYVKLLKKLEFECSYVEIVILDGKETNELVSKFKNDIIETIKVSKWWSTETRSFNNLYRIKATNKLFEFLEKYETFCKYFFSEKGDYNEITDFGCDDIAFYDENNDYLLFTTTHEGNIAISDEFI